MRLKILLTLLALPGAAWAQTSGAGPEIPYFDVDRACAQNVQPDPVRICVQMEQAAYNDLKRSWPQASVSARNAALRESARALQSRSYYQVLREYLGVALRMEELERPAPPPPRFQR